MVHRVVVAAFAGVNPFHLSVPWLVLGETFSGAVEKRYEVRVAAAQPGELDTAGPFGIVVRDGLDALTDADTVIVPTWDPSREADAALIQALRRAHDSGSRIVGLCLGAFVVAAAGLLDGREGVTHWAFTDELAKRHPGMRVRADVLWSDQGDVVTSAGIAASLDCCLHLVARDHGFAAAADLSRLLVMAPQRAGNQAQFQAKPFIPGDSADPIERAMVWARAHLAEPIDLATWSSKVAYAPRTFTRRFRARTGMSAQQWLVKQRVDHARLLLETTERGIEEVADLAGFGSAPLLRIHFRNQLGTTPQAYRQAFSAPKSAT